MDQFNLTSSDDSLNVLQISDSHLHADPNGQLLGLKTQKSLENCLKLAQTQYWPPDLIMLSGDLAHDASEEGYQRLHQLFNPLGIPICLVPGNHDSAATMERILTGGSFISEKSIVAKYWQIILLDSAVPGSEAGYLSNVDLEHLEKCLELQPNHHVLVCLHHPPMEINCRWLDPIKLENSELLFNTLKNYSNVRVIVCGHIHQEHEIENNGIKVLSAPSTCIQFKPESAEFVLDNKAPGFRWLKLHTNGEFETSVSRLDNIPAELEFSSFGY